MYIEIITRNREKKKGKIYQITLTINSEKNI